MCPCLIFFLESSPAFQERYQSARLCWIFSLHFILSRTSLLPSAGRCPANRIVHHSTNRSNHIRLPPPQARIYSLQFGKFGLPRTAQKIRVHCPTYLCSGLTIPWLSLAAKSRKANVDSSNLDAFSIWNSPHAACTRAHVYTQLLSAFALRLDSRRGVPFYCKEVM